MNLLPDDPLDLTILLYKSMPNREVASGQLSGTVSDEIDFEAVEARLDSCDLLIAANKNLRFLEFHLPIDFFISLSALLEAPSRRITPPPRFYLADCDYQHKNDSVSPPEPVERYIAATKLYSLLEKTADHQGGIGSAKTLIFLQKEKIEFAPEYNSENLCTLTGISEFQSEFTESKTHKEQKKTIIKTVLLEMFTGRSRVPFSELLSQFSEFLEKVQASYQLYVSEFSFQKVKAEVEKEKLDATTKLNKVFSDIQNQLLAVPAALVLAGGQMEDKAAWSSKNLLIWLGVLVFAVLMTLLVRNQRHTLHAVQQEIDQQWQQIKGKHHSVADRFSASYKQLDKRYRHQERLIRVVDLLVALALAVTTGMLLHFSVSRELLIESLLWGIYCALPMLTYDVLAWTVVKWLPEKFKKKLQGMAGIAKIKF
jgi:hypothetical protein